MATRKVMLINGMAELEKLDAQNTPAYKFVVERAVLHLMRKPSVSQTSNAEYPTVIVSASPQVVTVCQLNRTEKAPDELPRVRYASI